MKMKIINVFITIVLLSFATTSLLAQKNIKNDKNNPKDEVSVQVDGLGCPFCAYGLEKKMKELKGVKAFKIEMESGLTSFTYPTEHNISIEEVKYQVIKAGYTPMALSIKRADGSIEEFEYETPEIDYTANQTIEFDVAGNCNMCRGRIERAVMSLYGVSDAKWNKKKKYVTIKYLDSQVSERDLHEAISAAGYDTEKMKAIDDAYSALPGCCQYDRIEIDAIVPFKKNTSTDNVE